MKFLEAHRLVRDLEGGKPVPLLLGMSGTADPLLLFLRAAGAKLGLAVEPEVLPFGTLRQTLLSGPGTEEGRIERFILMPWDLVPELDWRTGFPDRVADADELRDEARAFLAGVDPDRIRGAFYLPAPLPPVHSHPEETRRLGTLLAGTAAEAGASLWTPARFSLSSYLSSGAPLASQELGTVAADVIRTLPPASEPPKKVLVTDLDGVLWKGVLGDAGPEGVESGPEGSGFRHFIYQTMLGKLRREGILLAVVSRNDPDLVEAAFERATLALRRDDFVSVLAGYGAKSAQIRELAGALNLGLDSFVFVDDNPVELAEVEGALPAVTTLPFPTSDDGLEAFLGRIADLFARRRLTEEDARRTELYRRRVEGLAPSDAEGADLTAFLRGLEMRLQIRDRSEGDRERAVQLINKTNQFNLNGIRRSDEEVEMMLAEGGRLYSARLTDRSGDHGEILACLLDPKGTVRSFVMSCRVFQRRVEDVFLLWLLRRLGSSVEVEFRPTERNEPLRSFLQRLGAPPGGDAGSLTLDLSTVEATLEDALELMELDVEPRAPAARLPGGAP